jgi:chorismate dehydratase
MTRFDLFRVPRTKAGAQGQQHLAAIIEKENYPFYDLEKYYTENISYVLDDEKRKGLELFLNKIAG